MIASPSAQHRPSRPARARHRRPHGAPACRRPTSTPNCSSGTCSGSAAGAVQAKVHTDGELTDAQAAELARARRAAGRTRAAAAHHRAGAVPLAGACGRPRRVRAATGDRAGRPVRDRRPAGRRVARAHRCRSRHRQRRHRARHGDRGAALASVRGRDLAARFIGGPRETSARSAAANATLVFIDLADALPELEAPSMSSSRTRRTSRQGRFPATRRCGCSTPSSPSTGARTDWMSCAWSPRPPADCCAPVARS